MYPIFLNLKNKKCTVIGGGKVAERKVLSLLVSGADITVISPTLTAKLSLLVSSNKINHTARNYKSGDLDSAFMAFGATNDTNANSLIHKDASSGNILINIVDEPEKCSFFVPSAINRGKLTIAISTEGESPALAKHIRKKLEKQIGPEYGPFLEIVADFRKIAKEKYSGSPAKMEKVYKQLFESDALSLISKGDKALAKKRMAECI
jgi:precorrin-2 dehydrogenase/sirohydrochlorin ferrochelatase